MAWTAPRTWADGEVVTALLINTHLRDNLLAIDQHAHAGGGGDGEQFLTSLDYIDFDHQAGLGAGASGHLKIWAESDGTIKIHNAGGSEQTLANNAHASDHEPSGGDVMAVDAAVGTGSLRTLDDVTGTSGATGSHAHSFAVDIHIDQTTRYTDGSTTMFVDLITITDGDDVESKTDTYAEKTEVGIAGGMLAYGNHGAPVRVSVQLFFDGTLLQSSSIFLESTPAWRFLKDTVSIAGAAGGSKIVLLEWKNTGSAASMGQAASYLHAIAFDRT